MYFPGASQYYEMLFILHLEEEISKISYLFFYVLTDYMKYLAKVAFVQVNPPFNKKGKY